MERAVVTGGTGFIGSWLAEELAEQGVWVIALVRDQEKAAANARLDHSRITFVEFGSEEFERLIEEKEKIDVFYHLAWAGVPPELKNECELQLSNLHLAMEMLELADRLGAARFIATGTVAEYAFSETIMDVNGRQTPTDMYGAAKASACLLLETRTKLMKMPFNWVVIPSTFGEGRTGNNIISYTIRSLLNGVRPQYGNLTQMWDFLYVKEVVRALRLIGERGQHDKTYGIGSGVFRPLKSYITQIRDIIAPEAELGIGEIPSLSEKTSSSCVNIYDLTKDTGFLPEIDFETGIRRTIEYYRNIG